MKGATEVPTTITVIIIQYTLIKRMKCELAFPISPTYSLNVKYSSHGLPPWKHRGTVGISRTATTVLLRERRSGGELRRVRMARSHAASPTEACPGSTGHGTTVLPSSSHSLSVSGLFPDTRLWPAAAPRIFCPERSQGVGPVQLKEVCPFSMA